MTGSRSPRTHGPHDFTFQGLQDPSVGKLDLEALRAQDPTDLLKDIDQALVYDIPLNTTFRALKRRDGVLFHGPAGWGEFAPFWDYDAKAAAPWLAAALEAATGLGPDGTPVTLPPRQRESIDVNVTIPEVGPDDARRLILTSRANVAKVKIGRNYFLRHVPGLRPDPPRDRQEFIGRGPNIHELGRDILRLEAVRDALGPRGRIRIDLNGDWNPTTVQRLLPVIERAAGGVEYVEQPCATTEDLATLRQEIVTPIAADESIRLSNDPLAVSRLEAADIAILKVAPLGGVRRTLELASRLELPVVVSSALDTSVGLFQGLQLATVLPELDYACGLGTTVLLKRDVADPSIIPYKGVLRVSDLHVSEERLAASAAKTNLCSRWAIRMVHIIRALAERRAREAADPSKAVAGIPL